MSINKIEQLRNIIKQHKCDALIVPSSDDHKSEYISDFWKIRDWLTGFTGSAGTAVITSKHAGLWTDSRYFIQAEKQLQKPFVMHKLITRGPEYVDWLCKELKMGTNVAFDPELFSLSEIKIFEAKFSKYNINLCPVSQIFNQLWVDRPYLPKNKLRVHPEKYCGLSRTEKLNKIQQHLNNEGIDKLLVSALDDIAWLMNLRGSDVPYNPVFRAYALVSKMDATLYIDNEKIDSVIKKELLVDQIAIKAYDDLEGDLQNCNNYSSIEIDQNTLNYKTALAIPNNLTIIETKSLVGQFKAIKTPSEIAHYKNAQIRDGVAMCEFLFWLEQNLQTRAITEIEAAEKLNGFRSSKANFMSLSFETISAYGKNAASPHYTCEPTKPVYIEKKGLYLVDSGGQYLDGTTDVTRTIAVGEASANEILDFTLVLKAHIKVATAIFPYGTRGFHIDTLARIDMWQHGKDFGHGTGHGIGYFLNVHEGPHALSQTHLGPAQTILEPGMFITNEPGIYIEKSHGIRTENVMICINDKKTDFGQFLKFETVSYCPIDKNLMNLSMLTDFEINWINQYHKTVWNNLHESCYNSLKDWLKDKTSPLNTTH